jgi:hypothetical protein
MKQNFFQKNKVVISGAVLATTLAIMELSKAGEASTKALIFAGAIALTAFLARNLRGQWSTIATMLGTSVATYVSMEQTGNVSWLQLVGQAIVLFLGATAPPAKDREYEHSTPILEAKEEAAAMKEKKDGPTINYTNARM